MFYYAFGNFLRQINKLSLSPAPGKKNIKGRKLTSGHPYLKPISLTCEIFTNSGASSSFSKDFVIFLVTRISCSFTGDLVLVKGTKLLS